MPIVHWNAIGEEWGPAGVGAKLRRGFLTLALVPFEDLTAEVC